LRIQQVRLYRPGATVVLLVPGLHAHLVATLRSGRPRGLVDSVAARLCCHSSAVRQV
jgi:hypothetical protein